jgi:hypothetical protein
MLGSVMSLPWLADLRLPRWRREPRCCTFGDNDHDRFGGTRQLPAAGIHTAYWFLIPRGFAMRGITFAVHRRADDGQWQHVTTGWDLDISDNAPDDAELSALLANWLTECAESSGEWSLTAYLHGEPIRCGVVTLHAA